MERRQLCGFDEIEASLARNEAPRLVLIRREARSAVLDALRTRLEAASIVTREISVNDLRRMSRVRPEPDVLALMGPDPDVAPQEWLKRPGPAWLLLGVRFPGNAGFAIRMAEVSGAAGIILDLDGDRAERQKALRASMYADRFLPVSWLSSEEAIDAARTCGRRVIGIEDSGSESPWSRNLTVPSLFIVGGEEAGVSAGLLARCDDVMRIPMAGFIPSYNLQAAMAMVAGEQLRQRLA